MKAEITSRISTRHSFPDNAVRATPTVVAIVSFYPLPDCGGKIEGAVLRLCLLLFAASAAGAQMYQLSGRITPAGRGSVTLFGATQPFTASTLTDEAGRFTFRKLAAATYTLSVFLQGRGEARQTIEVGPSVADSHRRVQVSLSLKDSDFDPTPDRRRHAVSARQLTIPERALRDYEDAQRDLERHAAEA